MANPVFPNGIKQWTDKVDFVDDVSANHINDAYAEIIAIETELHGATSAATPNKYIKRDADGRAKIVTPIADADIVNKKYIDDKVKTDVPENANFSNTTYSEITTAEIDAGTASRLRTITGRRVKYILDKVQGWISAITKSDIGLGNVDNAKQATKVEFNEHKADYASLFTANADAKNSIYRGKYLGNTVTSEQYAAISSGTFADLYIGDYWTIGGINWRIAAFNYYRNTGDTLVPSNHITIVPDTQLYTHVMNDTHITTGGYTGSKMYTVGLEQAKTTIRGIFGTHLVKHRQLHSNAIVGGKASGWAWVDSEVDLMSEIMVYGSTVWGESTIGGTGYNIGVGKSQLPLFALNPRMINTRQNYWLRDVASASTFAYVGNTGHAGYSNASLAFGVRPAFSIS